MITADPSTAAARSASGTPGSAVTTTVSAPTATAPSSSVASIPNTRMYRDQNPARRRRGTAATWFSVWDAENTTPVPENSRPIRPTMNGTVDVGKAASEFSTVERSAAGMVAVMSRCRSSGLSARTRDRTATPSSSNGKMLRNP